MSPLSKGAEAAEVSFNILKKPRDIFLQDMDNHAKAVVATQECALGMI
jgi:hypothetical protein